MGRKKKYQTTEELKLAKASQWKAWYGRNKETLNAHRMKIYYGRKEMGEKLPNVR